MQQQYSEDTSQMQRMNKWRGSVRKAVKSPVERVWKLSADFLGLKKWMPHIEIGRHVDGEANAVGCVRHCSGSKPAISDGGKLWVKEKLLSIDEGSRAYSYSIIDGNFGMAGYVASFRVCHVEDGNAVVECSFEADPWEEGTEEAFVEKMGSYFDKMIERLDEAAAASPPQVVVS